MMVEATPPAPFVLAEPGLLFELLIIAGNAPPQLGGVDQIAGRDVARKGRERVQRGRVAWLPPSWHHVHRSLRIPDLREGDDSPLRTAFRRAAPATCRTRQLPTPRIPPCGLNGTSQTRSPPCAEGSSQLSSDDYRDAHAAAAQPGNGRVVICNAVVLGLISRDLPRASGRKATRAIAAAECIGLEGSRQRAAERAAFHISMSL